MPITCWDDLRLILAIARSGRLNGAARMLGVDHTTIGRKLTALEDEIGVRLFVRSTRGVSPTPAGQHLLAHARRIDSEIEAATAELDGVEQGARGKVRLATPEAFGTYLVAPNLALLHERYPDLSLELVPESRSVSLAEREADIAISLDRPPKGRLVVCKLTDYRLGLFAAENYLNRSPPIRSVADIKEHSLIGYIDQMIDMPGLRYLGEIVAGGRTVFRSTSIVAQHEAIAAGTGIGLLHLFSVNQGSGLRRILVDEVEINRSYWMMFHQDNQKSATIRAVVNFIQEIIKSNRYLF